MHTYFRKVADNLLGKRPQELANVEDVKNLQHVLRLAISDNDKLREGFPVQDSDGCLTLGDLDAIMSEIKDADLRTLLNAKIARAMAKKQNAASMGDGVKIK